MTANMTKYGGVARCDVRLLPWARLTLLSLLAGGVALLSPVPLAAQPLQLPGSPGVEVIAPPSGQPRRPATEQRPGQSDSTPVIRRVVPVQRKLSREERQRLAGLFRRAKAGDVAAMRELAELHQRGVPGLKKSLARAAHWYRRAAQAGDVVAQYRLGRLLLNGGDGVRRAPRVAAALFLAAAERGHVPSMYSLGHLLEKGIGVPRDVDEARKWYLKAAEKGHAPAQVALGLMALAGRGMQRDFEKARKWFARAAEKRDGWALNNLGAMYEMGWGVLKDREKAIIFYELARENGSPAGERNLLRLGALQPEPKAGPGGQAGQQQEGQGATPAQGGAAARN